MRGKFLRRIGAGITAAMMLATASSAFATTITDLKYNSDDHTLTVTYTSENKGDATFLVYAAGGTDLGEISLMSNSEYMGDREEVGYNNQNILYVDQEAPAGDSGTYTKVMHLKNTQVTNQVVVGVGGKDETPSAKIFTLIDVPASVDWADNAAQPNNPNKAYLPPVKFKSDGNQELEPDPKAVSDLVTSLNLPGWAVIKRADLQNGEDTQPTRVEVTWNVDKQYDPNGSATSLKLNPDFTWPKNFNQKYIKPENNHLASINVPLVKEITVAGVKTDPTAEELNPEEKPTLEVSQGTDAEGVAAYLKGQVKITIDPEQMTIADPAESPELSQEAKDTLEKLEYHAKNWESEDWERAEKPGDSGTFTAAVTGDNLETAAPIPGVEVTFAGVSDLTAKVGISEKGEANASTIAFADESGENVSVSTLNVANGTLLTAVEGLPQYIKVTEAKAADVAIDDIDSITPKAVAINNDWVAADGKAYDGTVAGTYTLRPNIAAGTKLGETGEYIIKLSDVEKLPTVTIEVAEPITINKLELTPNGLTKDTTTRSAFETAVTTGTLKAWADDALQEAIKMSDLSGIEFDYTGISHENGAELAPGDTVKVTATFAHTGYKLAASGTGYTLSGDGKVEFEVKIPVGFVLGDVDGDGHVGLMNDYASAYQLFRKTYEPQGANEAEQEADMARAKSAAKVITAKNPELPVTMDDYAAVYQMFRHTYEPEDEDD